MPIACAGSRFALKILNRGRHPELLATSGGEPRGWQCVVAHPSRRRARARLVRMTVLRSFGNQRSREIVMSRKNSRISRAAIAAACAVLLPAASAFASQGPGGGMGTASNLTQIAVAVIVYGASALIVGTGLIGALRRR